MKDLEIQKSAVNPHGQAKTQKGASITGSNPGDKDMQTSPCKKIDPCSTKGVKRFDKGK